MRLLVVVLLAGALSVAGLAVGPGAAEARKPCGKASSGNITVRVVVRRGPVPCWKARRIVRRNFLFAARAVPGWFCFTAHRGPGDPPLKRVGSCAPNGQDPDTARRAIAIFRA